MPDRQVGITVAFIYSFFLQNVNSLLTIQTIRLSLTKNYFCAHIFFNQPHENISLCLPHHGSNFLPH